MEKIVNITILTSKYDNNLFNFVNKLNNYIDIKISNILCNNKDEIKNLKLRLRRFKINIDSIDNINIDSDYIFVYNYDNKVNQNIINKFRWRIIRFEKLLNNKIHRYYDLKPNTIDNCGLIIYYVNENLTKNDILFEKTINLTENEKSYENAISNIDVIEENYLMIIIEKFILGTYKQ